LPRGCLAPRRWKPPCSLPGGALAISCRGEKGERKAVPHPCLPRLALGLHPRCGNITAPSSHTPRAGRVPWPCEGPREEGPLCTPGAFRLCGLPEGRQRHITQMVHNVKLNVPIGMYSSALSASLRDGPSSSRAETQGAQRGFVRAETRRRGGVVPGGAAASHSKGSHEDTKMPGAASRLALHLRVFV
jgi:hypothetical protein